VSEERQQADLPEPTRPGDRPIERMSQDAMEWERHIRALLRTLERADTPFVLGVYGGWGSGKTSFVNCLADAATRGEYAETPQYEWRVVKANPWECDTPDDAAAGFFDQCACLLNPDVPIGDEMRELLLNHVLQRNPRAIKRFCLTHGLLAELGEDLDGDRLAKVLAIRMRFPSLHRFYSLPGGAALLLQDQRDARGETEGEEDLVDARGAMMRREEAQRYVGWLEDPAVRMVLAAEPPFDDEHDVDRYFELAGAGAEAEGGVPDELAAALRMLESDSAKDRYHGARVLGAIGDARAVEPLTERLLDEDDEVRNVAREAIAKIEAAIAEQADGEEAEGEGEPEQ